MKKLLVFMMFAFLVNVSFAQVVDIINDSTATFNIGGQEVILKGDFKNEGIVVVAGGVDSTIVEYTEATEGLSFPKSVNEAFPFLLALLPFFNRWWIRGTRIWKTIKPYFSDMGTDSILWLSSLLLGTVWEAVMSIREGSILLFSGKDWSFYSLFILGSSMIIYQATKRVFGATPKKEEVQAELASVKN